MMKLTTVTRAMIAVASVVYLCGSGLAQDAVTKTIGRPSVRTVPSLIVMNADGAKLDGTTLTLTGISRNSIMFADRPVRAAGHDLTAHLLEEWAPGSGSFAKDPPNATVSVLDKDGAAVEDAVVVLKDPKLSGDTLTFDVEVLESNLAKADGPASIFIDSLGFSFGGRDGAWYNGSASADGCGPPWNPCF